MVDTHAKFLFIDDGDYGWNRDSRVFHESNCSKLFNTNKLNIPLPKQLYKENAKKFPYVFLGDGAYPLSKIFYVHFQKGIE